MSDSAGRIALAALAERLRAEGGLLAPVTHPPAPDAPAEHGDRVAAGSRTQAAPATYALLVEAIREGHELHHGIPRVCAPDDPDLALLAGDRLYALGLQELAALGDLPAVAALADVISGAASAHAAGDPAAAEAVWRRGAQLVAGG